MSHEACDLIESWDTARQSLIQLFLSKRQIKTFLQKEFCLEFFQNSNFLYNAGKGNFCLGQNLEEKVTWVRWPDAHAYRFAFDPPDFLLWINDQLTLNCLNSFQIKPTQKLDFWKNFKQNTLYLKFAFTCTPDTVSGSRRRWSWW